jgi:hypothetical protein
MPATSGASVPMAMAQPPLWESETLGLGKRSAVVSSGRRRAASRSLRALRPRSQEVCRFGVESPARCICSDGVRRLAS